MLTRRAFLQGVGAAGGTLTVAPSLPLAGQSTWPPASILMQTPIASPSRQYAVAFTDVEYRRDGDEAFLARVYQPQGAEPFPALLDIHGGAWIALDRTSNTPISEVLAASGLVVFAPDFRNGTPATPYPASLLDINYATRWLKAHARDVNASPDRVGGMVRAPST
jgi:acetyl esterase/lipase